MASMPCLSDAPADFHDGSYLSAIKGFESELHNATAHSKESGELLFNIASSAYALGNLAKAENYFRQSVFSMQKACGDSSLEVSIAQEGLVATLLEQGNLIDADNLLQTLYATRSKLLTDNHPQLVRLKTLLASISWEMGDKEKAATEFYEALFGIRKIYGNIHPHNASTAQCIGNMFLETENDWIAEIMHRQAKLILSTLHSEDHPILLSSLNNIGAINIDINQLPDSRTSFELALSIIEQHKESGSISPIEEMRTLTGLGRINFAEGNIPQAISLLEKAIDCYFMAWITTGSESVKATFLTPPHSTLAAVLLADNRPLEAWQVIEQMRGQVIQLSKFEAELSAPVQESISMLRHKLINLENKMSSNDSNDTVFAKWTEYNSALTNLLNHTTAKMLMNCNIDLSAVQKNLKHNDALIGWLDAPLSGNKHTRFVYVIKSTGTIEWRELPDQQNNRALVNQFIQSIHSPLPFSDSWTTLSDQIWEKRFAPAADLLTDVTRLYAVCSNTMAGIPLDAVRSSNGKFLVDQMCIITTPSASLISGKKTDKSEPLRSDILLIADPAFNENYKADFEVTANNVMPNESVIRSALARNAASLAQLPRLYNSRTEATQIAELFENSKLMLGADASENSLTNLTLDRWRVIHLATHALVDSHSPDRSALVLSQLDLQKNSAKNNYSNYDGLMSAREIRMSWSLDSDLVVLSACETGLGKQTESDGFLGLTNAFLSVGAKNLVTSLWKVNDKATQKLMVSFYEKMAESNSFNPAQCLMLSKQDLRNFRTENGRRPYDCPSIWASFVLVGGAQ